MIDELHLKDIALIREATFEPSRSLTVITGESGSGKTALLSGIKLLVGERGSADMVREGSDALEVEGRFFTRGASDEGVVAFRSVTADGRSRVRLDGSLATVGELSDAVGEGIDLCGQHEHQRLMKVANQAAMLDSWAGDALEGPLAGYRSALADAREARRALEELRGLGQEGAARLEEARFTLRRIDEVSPREGEYEELLAEARRMENLEELVRATGGAREALAGESGAIDAVNSAIVALEAATTFDARLSSQAGALRDACYILEDAAREVDALMPDSDAFDAARLEEVQGRLSSFQGLMRAFGPTMDEVLERRAQAAAQLEVVDGLGERLAAAERGLQRAEEALAAAAEEVSAVRRTQAPAFEQAVNEVLAELEMPGCALVCSIVRLERGRWGEDGPDQVEFLFRPGAGLEPRPLARIASGGEVSRVMLAVKAVLGATDEVDTLVFDEVDAGVGGKAALAVGEVLRRLSQTHQVIVVTHLPQIAVLGDVHYVVERASGDAAETVLRVVSGPRRVREVARMLSGSLDMPSLVHAEEMLRDAVR